MRRLLALLFVAAMARAAEPPAAVKEALAKGETLDFTLTWLKVSGGSARMTISPLPSIAGSLARYKMTSVAKSGVFFSRFFRVRDSVESVVAADSFSTLSYRKHLDERGHIKDELTTIDPATGIATRKGKEIAVPRPVLDPLSMIYYLRQFDLVPGASFQVTLIADGKVHTITATVRQRETITTDAGTFKTVVVEPELPGSGVFRDDQSRLLIWYSDDDRHLPVRVRSDVKFGTITASLRSIRAGVTGIEPANLRGQ